MAWQVDSIYGDGSNGHHRFTLTVTEDSTNINTNQSWVSWKFVMSPLGNGWDWYYSNQVPVSWVLYINGTQYSGNIMNYDGYSTIDIHSGGTFIDHDSNGDKTIEYSFSIWSLGAAYLPGSASANGSMALTRINRKATIVSAPNFNDTEKPTMVFSNPAGNAVESLKVGIYDINGQYPYAAYREISDKTSTSYTFDLTSEELALIYSASADLSDSLPVTFYVYTKIGGLEFTDFVYREVTIVDADPVITTATIADEGSFSQYLTDEYPTVIVSGCNYVKCVMEVTLKKGAGIFRKTVTCGNKIVDIDLDGNYCILQNVENPEFIFTVWDTRGNKSEKKVNASEFVQYVRLTCDLGVTMVAHEDDAYSDAHLDISGNFFNSKFGANGLQNTLSLYYRYKTKTGTYGDWQPITISQPTSNRYAYETEIPDLQMQETYTFQIRAADLMHNGVNNVYIQSNVYIARTVPAFDWSEEDFNFNVPVTIQGKKVLPDPSERICRVFTEQAVSYNPGDYINFKRSDSSEELYNSSVAVFSVDGLIYLYGNMTVLINIHVCGNNPDGDRTWLRLMNYDTNWRYAECINYGTFTTSTISTILTVDDEACIGVKTLEALDMNSSGFTGSYIEIIQL